jgi:uncharacterized protein (DUF1800 family)
MNAPLRALNGFGLGARPGDVRRVDDPRGWLRAQLDAGAPLLQSSPETSRDAISRAVSAFRSIGQANDREQREARRQARRQLIEIAGAEGRAALTERATTERPFVERLVAFWSNHLCVSVAAKVLVVPFAGSYEREAIRPHVLGRFEDMVLASARHPAMLVYLDNVQSIGPGSRAGRFSGRAGRGQQRGLNENYARELLELHTLGVNGGYTQQDVQDLAKILSGWTVGGLVRGGRGRQGRPRNRAAESGTGFLFQEALHEPGAKAVLGVRYGEAGVEEGERVIRALCRHPSTAKFLATKLVAHFVSDDPPPAAVDRIARTFRESGGDLRAVSLALVDLPEAWTGSARKFRTPQDWMVAVLRAFGAHEVAESVMPVLRQLRHPLWSPQSPKGFGDRTDEWADPDSLLNRAELSRTVARRLRTRRVDPRVLVDTIDAPQDDPLRRMAADSSIAADERVALALAGPAFQWR